MAEKTCNRKSTRAPELLPHPPVKPVVCIEGDALQIIHRGLARNLLTLMLILAAACVSVPFILSIADTEPPTAGTVVLRWTIGGVLIGTCLAFAALFLVRTRRGDDHKVLAVDPAGLHVFTANPATPGRSMTFDEIEGIDIVHAGSNPEMGQARVGRHVRVAIADKPSLNLSCDSDRDATWLENQLRAAVEHFTGRPVPES